MCYTYIYIYIYLQLHILDVIILNFIKIFYLYFNGLFNIKYNCSQFQKKSISKKVITLLIHVSTIMLI